MIDSRPPPTTAWHAEAADAVEQTLHTGAHGLQPEEAARRLAQFGPNRLAPPKRRSAVVRLLLQFNNVLLYVMLAGGLITALLQHWVDTFVLLAAVVVNAIIGFIQEGKAENAMDSIRSMLSLRATVVRGKVQQEIDAAELVPGDRVLLISGDRVPADIRLVQVKELRVDEAALTGESLPVGKDTLAAPADAALGDRSGMAYSGTLVVSGKAAGVVVATGAATELGRINQLLTSIDTQTTPLLRQMDRFGHGLAYFIIAMCVLTFVIGTVWRGHAASDMFVMVVALAASAIPEGLPALMTVTLALGVQRMARRNAIIRRLPAVEALGSVTVICSDKTGTLTRNEMTVQRIVTAHARVDVQGVGYAPEGGFRVHKHDIAVQDDPVLALAIHAGVLCNDARLLQDGDEWRIEGDPTEAALLVLGEKAGWSAGPDKAWPRVDMIPFESDHRFMATYHHDPEGQPWIFVKGAPEVILDMCQFQAGLVNGQLQDQPLAVDYWRRMATDIAARGLRLLALACKRCVPADGKLAFCDAEQGYTLLALVGIIDPPRAEAIAAVAECHRAGIRVKMITGDHAETARAIGAQLNIGVDKPTLTGAEIGALDDATLRQVVQEVDVFARASPEQKLRLVQALQEGGQVVAMTGDGVNDAPALKRADVGVAMGLKGTEAAKEASAMVLADDHFATIAHAVREGRAIYDNLRKFVLFMLPTNGGEALVVFVAILFGLTLPMTAAQVLWINMVTACTLGLALAFEPAEKGIMERPPRPPQQAMLSGFFVWRVCMASALIMVGALGPFLWELSRGTHVDTARTIAVNAVVMCEIFYLFNSRYTVASVLNWRGLTGNPYVLYMIAAALLMQLAYTYAPFMQEIFQTTPLSAEEWLHVLGAGLMLFFLAEFEKWVLRRSGLAKRLKLA